MRASAPVNSPCRTGQTEKTQGQIYETNEGARGSRAVRQRNCQDWISSGLVNGGTKEEIAWSA